MDIDSAYLDYYNLDVNDENTVEQFVTRYNIPKKPQILSADEMRVKTLTIEKLIGQHYIEYKKAFDFFTKHTVDKIYSIIDKATSQLHKEAAKSWEEAEKGGGNVYYGFPQLDLFLKVQEHLKRTTLALVGIKSTGGYRWRIFWCADFLALVYLQLWLSVNENKVYATCPYCGGIFAKTRANQKYCDKRCKKRAADARYRAKRNANPVRKAEYNERMRKQMKKQYGKKS